MKRKKEIKYLDKEWNEMNSRLKAFVETGEQEELHKFRVQIKKLRAMLRMIEEASADRDLKKDFKPVKEIFKTAGHIREAHTNLELSERYHLKNENFETAQQRIIEEGTHNFKNSGENFFKNIRHAHKKLKKHLHRIGNNRIAQYYQTQLEHISANLAVSGFSEDMHTNRKLIKILVYNRKLAGKALNGSVKFNTAYLDQLQEAIGKWHDNLLAEQLFSSPEINDKSVAAKIKRVNASVKRNISLLTEDFLKKATTIEKTKMA